MKTKYTAEVKDQGKHFQIIENEIGKKKILISKKISVYFILEIK